jgi:hypothetical protein
MLVGPDGTRVDAERPLLLADRVVFDDDLVEDAVPALVRERTSAVGQTSATSPV